MRHFVFLLFYTLCLPNGTSEESENLDTDARLALAKATEFIRSISTEGAYLWEYSEDLSRRKGERDASESQAWVQSPGSNAMGMFFVRAFKVTQETQYLEAAEALAHAMVSGQLQSGGWSYSIEFDPKKRREWAYRVDQTVGKGLKNRSTYDDDNTQGALRFLMAYLTVVDSDDHVEEAVKFGLDRLMAAQYPVGAWPQRWEGEVAIEEDFPVQAARIPDSYPRKHSGRRYYLDYTLNDDCQIDVMRTLFLAWKLFGNEEYRSAVEQGAEFLLRAQLPEPQAAWAQQYNARMEPSWARAFEPPAIATRESVSAMHLLLDLYSKWGDERYLISCERASDWLREVKLSDRDWARLYELGTNIPIYGDRDGEIHYSLEEVSLERRTGYGWRGDFGATTVLRRFHEIKTGNSEVGTTRLLELIPVSGRANAAEARAAIEALDERGRWIRVANGESSIRTRDFLRYGGELLDFLDR